MTHTLYVADYAYSSWSLRGYLLLDAFGIAFEERYAHMRTDDFERLKAEMAPSRQVPALRHGVTGTLVWESLAIAETLAEEAPLWPGDAGPRAAARAVGSEMHAGFAALRRACPMNMRRAYAGFGVPADVAADLDRLATIWDHARQAGGGDGPYLFGVFTAADAFFAPVASRIATYDLPLAAEHRGYVAALLSHRSMQRWWAKAMADPHIQPHYEFDLPARPNPHDPAIGYPG